MFSLKGNLLPLALDFPQLDIPHYPMLAVTGVGANSTRNETCVEHVQLGDLSEELLCEPLRDDVAVYQAFTVGRVRFLLSDVRSESEPQSSIMGPEQKVSALLWFKFSLYQPSIRHVSPFGRCDYCLSAR